MKAIVLAAAKSKKLAPFSDTRPKSMITISGKYILENILNQIVESQVNEIWIVVNHKKEIIQDHFQYGKSLGVKLDYIEQPDELKLVKTEVQDNNLKLHEMNKVNTFLSTFHSEADLPSDDCRRDGEQYVEVNI